MPEIDPEAEDPLNQDVREYVLQSFSDQTSKIESQSKVFEKMIEEAKKVASDSLEKYAYETSGDLYFIKES